MFFTMDLKLFSVLLFILKTCSADLGALPQVTLTEFSPGDSEHGNDEASSVVTKPYNSDIIVGEDTQPGNSLLLSCVAPYPVQWVYHGDGRPELSTNTSVKFLQPGRKSETPIDFTAYAYISNPREKNTGNYTCRSLQDPRTSVYYFIYVPGPTLFTSSGDQAISFNRRDPDIRIPCSVSNPKALVGLQKAVNGLLNCPLNESISYDPKTGFHLKTHDFPNPGGRYICTAAYNNTVRYIEFNLTENGSGALDSEGINGCRNSNDCPEDKSCIESQCTDPCEDICGVNAKCRTIDHVPECYCPGNLVGDPYFLCRDRPLNLDQSTTTERPIGSDPCNPSPCGDDGECKFSGKVLVCVCKAGSFGTPPNCTPKHCSSKDECPSHQACIQGSCSDPCTTGVCGKNATCKVINQIPVCSCAEGFTGDPFDECKAPEPEDFLGVTSSSTAGVSDNSDVNAAPCKAMTCGRNSQCTVLGDGRPICRCMEGYNQGDPYTACYTESELVANPCMSSPCGPNTICQDAKNGSATCVCMPDMTGNPYKGCRRQNCLVHTDCQKNQMCYNHRCQDGCVGRNSCGANAKCKMEEHVARCYCAPGFTGNAEKFCHLITRPGVTKLQPTREGDPCNPSPCGRNAECSILQGRALCRCPSPLQGDPIAGCDLRCQRTSNCPSHQVCYAGNSTCVDPCAIYDTGCGENAVCKVSNHMPNCFCPQGYTGNPFKQCYKKLPSPSAPDNQKNEGTTPCYPLPCGANAVCVTTREGSSSTCACKTGYYGDPFSGCQQGSSCSTDNDCSVNTGCTNGRCLDPCKFNGACGINQECRVLNHKPSCYCRPGFPIKAQGNCYRESSNKAPLPESPVTPRPIATHRPPYQPQSQSQAQSCNACGPYSECQVTRGVIVCSCKPGMIGSPPNCRPECQYDGQCAFDKACIAYKCQDPCAGACGRNALCRIRQRTPVCTCPKGYYGNPVYGCKCCDHERTDIQDDEYDDQELDDSTFSPPVISVPAIHFNHTG